MSMNQKEATVSTILAVLAERDVEYEMNGPIPVKEVLTDSDKASVRTALFSMFKEGQITYKTEFQSSVDDDKELKKYVSGLVNNWIKKNKDFNGGQAYVPKNPGSRAHVGDEQLKALKALSGQTTDPDVLATITEAIVTRKSEIEASKAKSVVINKDALPEALRHLVK